MRAVIGYEQVVDAYACVEGKTLSYTVRKPMHGTVDYAAESCKSTTFVLQQKFPVRLSLSSTSASSGRSENMRNRDETA